MFQCHQVEVDFCRGFWNMNGFRSKTPRNVKFMEHNFHFFGGVSTIASSTSATGICRREIDALGPNVSAVPHDGHRGGGHQTVHSLWYLTNGLIIIIRIKIMRTTQPGGCFVSTAPYLFGRHVALVKTTLPSFSFSLSLCLWQTLRRVLCVSASIFSQTQAASDEVYRVLPSIDSGGAPFYWVLPGFTGFYQGSPGFYLVELGFIKFYWVLLGLNRFQWVLPSFYWVSLGFTRYYWVLLGFIGV